MKNKRKTTTKTYLTIAAVSALTCGAASMFLYNENNNIEKTFYRIGKESADKTTFRIVQVSDLHGKEFGKNNAVLLDEIERLSPDLIAMTGDIIWGYEPNFESAAVFLRKAGFIAPVVFVTGNHEEGYSGDELDGLLETFSDLGVKILDNESVFFEKNGKRIKIGGVSEKNLIAGNIDKNESECFSVLLAHIPHFCEFYEESGYDMVLTGHAHGGQIRMPFSKIPLVAPNQGLFPKYTEGSYTVGKTRVFVSRGLGRSVVPQRIFNKPELCVYDISL